MSKFFKNRYRCKCGKVIEMRDEIGYQEGIYAVQCPDCGNTIEVYANLEVSYKIMPTQKLKMCEILTHNNMIQ